jgi:exopolyphosphatase/guanosine-5'-triphosphate,3'-diphosphate pyrophosphatase
MTSLNADTQSELIAALDLGSNSFHLIIARLNAGKLEPLHKVKHRVRLRAGLNKANELSYEAMLRAASSLKEMGATIKTHQIKKCRVVATHTLREAVNRNAFLSLAEYSLGFPIEIISGSEEARLIYQGVVRSEEIKDSCLVVDIGGGSTEIVLGEGTDTQYRDSKNMGCISFTERYFSKGVNQKSFKRAEVSALQKLEQCSHHFRTSHPNKVFATSGTAKALFKATGLVSETTDRLELNTLLKLQHLLCQIDGVSKLSLVGIDEARAMVLPAGLAIMIALMKSLNLTALTFCSAALREGVLFEMEQQNKQGDTRLRTRQHLQRLYNVDRRQAQQIAETCELFWHQTSKSWSLTSTKLKTLLLEAAYLYEVGQQINVTDFQQHSAYILANSDLAGYNQDEQLLLSTIVIGARKRFRRRRLPDIRIISHKMLTRLIRLFRLAVILNNSRQPLVIDLLSLQVDGREMMLSIDKQFFLEQDVTMADLNKESSVMANLGYTLSCQIV